MSRQCAPSAPAKRRHSLTLQNAYARLLREPPRNWKYVLSHLVLLTLSSTRRLFLSSTEHHVRLATLRLHSPPSGHRDRHSSRDHRHRLLRARLPEAVRVRHRRRAGCLHEDGRADADGHRASRCPPRVLRWSGTHRRPAHAPRRARIRDRDAWRDPDRPSRRRVFLAGWLRVRADDACWVARRRLYRTRQLLDRCEASRPRELAAKLTIQDRHDRLDQGGTRVWLLF